LHLIVRQGKETKFLKGIGNTALGIDEDLKFHREEIVLNPGDTLFMYMDGVTEAFNEQNEEFSKERLVKEVTLFHQDSIKKMVLATFENIKLFSGKMPQSDDIAILGLKYYHTN
jgi:sigma-B regulation protein RsbU (phosphoserine phosphatase)